MPIGETIPTIGELKGNTILELFKNGYNALKNALFGKQNKLVAGDNIVIDETTNRISAIEGGTPVLDDYYTKTQVDGFLDAKADTDDIYDKTYVDNLVIDINGELDDKADTSDVYDKTEVDNLIASVNGNVDIIEPTLTIYGSEIEFTEELKLGDIIVCNIMGNVARIMNMVVSYNDSNTIARNGITVVEITRTDSSNCTFRIHNWGLRKFTENTYHITNSYHDVTITDGVISVGAYSSQTMVAENSKVTIYRKKVVQ